tara:strand:+ start:1950 stop:2159 length:210 start_codon:yes stop_codon:yes gene_type:complete
MKTKNIPTDIKSKSLNDAKTEILHILERLESQTADLEGSKKDYERLLILNNHINDIFKQRLDNIRSKKK